MASAHIYRDALLWHGVRPVVSLLLVPAPIEAAWLSAMEFQQEARVGAYTIGSNLPGILAKWLTSIEVLRSSEATG